MDKGIGSGPSLPTDVVAHARAEGALESPWIWVALSVLALACLVLVFARRRRKLAIVGVVVFGLLAGLTGLNTYVGYIRTPHDLGMVLARGPGFIGDMGRLLAADTADGSSDEHVAQGARALGRARSAAGDGALRVVRMPLPDPALQAGPGMTNVLLPPGYDDPANAGRRYPVVYLIHGYPEGSSDDWFTAGDLLGTMHELLDHQLVAPMIVVSPDMSAGVRSTDWECLDVPGGPRLETYLADDVVPQIDRRFRTLTDRRERAIGGMSGGAFCALNIGLHHLAEFGVSLQTLPYDSPEAAAALLGPNPALVAANTPARYLLRMRFTQTQATMVDVGLGAPEDVRTGLRIARALAAQGQPVALRREPGMNHTWNTARAALPFLLSYANQVFTNPDSLRTQPPPSGGLTSVKAQALGVRHRRMTPAARY